MYQWVIDGWHFVKDNFFTAGIIVGATYYLARTITNKAVDTHFNKMLETHKKEINKELSAFTEEKKHLLQTDLENHKNKLSRELSAFSENEKFTLQRKLQDFGLYTNKRHEVYPELFKLILMAEGHVEGLEGYIRSYDYTKLSIEDFDDMLTRKNVAKGIKTELLEILDKDKEDGIKKYHQLMRNLAIEDADESLRDAKNYLLLSQLYISDEVIALSNEVLDDMRDLHGWIEWPNITNIHDAYQEKKSLKANLSANLEKLKVRMRSELAIADYDKK